MANKTKKKYEEYLNSMDVSIEDCEYLSNPRRSGKVVRRSSLINMLSNRRYGYLIRKYDPIAFEVGFDEWKNN